MSFFEQQARARGASGRLVVLFVLAVIGVVLAVNLVIGIAWRTAIGRGIAPYVIDASGTVSLRSAAAPSGVYVLTTIITLAVIGIRTVIAVYGLRDGGDAVARMAGAVPVDRSTHDPD